MHTFYLKGGVTERGSDRERDLISADVILTRPQRPDLGWAKPGTGRFL